jgi:hypothetical protein
MESDNKFHWYFRYSKKPTILIEWLKNSKIDNILLYDTKLHLWKEISYNTCKEESFSRDQNDSELLLLKQIINNKGLALLNIRMDDYFSPLIPLIAQEIIINNNQITMVEI